MNAGQLNKRIVIQQYGSTQNEYGEQVKTWSTVKTVWASVQPLQGREWFNAKQIQSEVEVRMRLRYTTAITPKMRIQYNSLNYNIESVINVGEQNREIELMCSKVTT
uniref:Putative head-tail joining protein n=1 Tax=viral metagenome TaxID=1070528 RepID=A0A6M3J9L2_9ZZZZ